LQDKTEGSGFNEQAYQAKNMHELKKCNSCGNTYPSDLSFCLNDGSPLVRLDTLIGTVLDGRYRLDSLIGEGGMGDVYRATHVHLDTEFAVKLLKPEFVANQTAIKRFRLEAKAAGRIHHPNAIRVTDFGVTPESIVYLVMEIVEGQSLRSLMRSEKVFDYIRAVNIVRQACGAVEAAHHSGVIHRDLKPDNILIERVRDVERVKVLDFGIAKLKETKPDAYLTQAGTIIGTPQYMSPEQSQGKHLDPPSDIYSLGVILYEMLSGEVPFDGDSTFQVVYKQLHEPPRPLQEVAPNVPALLARVVMRALEKDPDRRQASAAQLSDELKQAVEMVGEGDSLSLTNPLVVQPLSAADSAQTPIFEVPTLRERDSQGVPLVEGQPPRETSVLFSPTTDSDAATTQDESRRITEPDEKLPTRQSAPAGERKTAALAVGKGARTRLIILAAVALVALVGVIIYFMVKPAAVPAEPRTPTPPEGMVYIPGGKFVMGRNDGESDEGPAHEVEVTPFFFDVYEVTNKDYRKFVDAMEHPAPKHWTFDGSYAPDEEKLPVTYMTWTDATSYCQWAGKRLPLEKEWEYAARGGSKGYIYPWGGEWQIGYANVNRQDQSKPSPVGSFGKDVGLFGIYDLAGNVSEWVQDFYTAGYGAKPDQKYKVYRGGNFWDPPARGIATFRWYDYPVPSQDINAFRIGFRCAKDVKQ
jgi:serine/threonine-protein kinase